MRLSTRTRRLLVIPPLFCALLVGTAVGGIQDTCGPFTDVSALFCPYVLEAYYTGITAGTSPTTFSPDVPITRGQSAVFTTKALNQALARGSRRAALGQWWPMIAINAVDDTSIGSFPGQPACDGTDIWVPVSSGTVARVRGSDGRVLETWTGAAGAFSALAAIGRVFIIGIESEPRSVKLYVIDPSQPAGALTPVASDLQSGGRMAFDGSRLWTANIDGTLSYFTPSGWNETVVAGPVGWQFIVFDGKNLWTQSGDFTGIVRLDSNGAVIQTVPGYASNALFDGANLWLTGGVASPSITVVQASSGNVLSVLTGNGMATPSFLGFDGQRILVANGFSTYNVSLWNAADLSPIGFAPLGLSAGVCSDGINFWVSRTKTGDLARY